MGNVVSLAEYRAEKASELPADWQPDDWDEWLRCWYLDIENEPLDAGA